MNPQLNFHQIIVKFFQPLTKQPFIVKFFQPLIKHPFRTVTASVIISIVLFVGVDILLAEVVWQNSYNINILSIELLNELGPDYAGESKQHAKMIKRYTDHMEQRKYATILRILCPEYSPKKALASAREALEKATEEENAKETIWQAGLVSNQFYTLGKRFPRSPIAWFTSEVVSDRLLMDLDNEFDTFHEMVDQFEKAQTVEAAVKGSRATCSSSRKAFILLSLARLGYDNEKKKIERFLSDLKQARDLADLFAETEEYKSQQKALYDRARNIGLRAKVVKAMLDNNMDSACDILREAIEEAIEKEKGNTAE